MRTLSTILLLLHCNALFSQNHDHVWVLGYNSQVEDSLFGGSFIDFNESLPSIYKGDLPLNFLITNASICDSTGNLQLYSNAIQIANGQGEIIPGGTGLTPGVIADDFENRGYLLDQGAIFLPSPSSNSSFHLIHADREDPIGSLFSHSRKIYTTLIESNSDSQEEHIAYKNKVIVNDILEPGKITATKHANGRDWWILSRVYSSNEYLKILLSEDTPAVVETQQIGDSIPSPGVGQAVFSPDGSKYVRLTLIDYEKGGFLSIYDFDRCSGDLSNPILINHKDSASAGGVAISPNSRFLYVSSLRYIYQYDLWSADILASKDTVAVYDGFLDPFPTLFYHCQLAPDGKIYINTANGSTILHVIHQPDLKGDACMMEQHGIQLPTHNAFSLPNFPNYRLGPLEGSPCDTLTLTSSTPIPEQEFDFQVYPNPASDFIYLSSEWDYPLGARSLHWRLIDALGRVVKRVRVNYGSLREKVDVSDLQPGVYFWEVDSIKGVLGSGKLVKE